MPPDRHEWPSRLKAVEREFAVLQLAVRRLDAQLRSDPSHPDLASVRLRDLAAAMGRLEGTYLIRRFAEFETGLRQYWGTFRESHPKTEDLLHGIGSRRKIPSDLIDEAHAVRTHRNALVHERDDAADRRGLADARSSLCRYLARLPERW